MRYTLEHICAAFWRKRTKFQHDRRLRNDMVKRVEKSLKLLREQGLAVNFRDDAGQHVWKLAT
jgi:hypothetical protein